MTREEVVEIMNYCKEHKVTYKSRLEELNIPVMHDDQHGTALCRRAIIG